MDRRSFCQTLAATGVTSAAASVFRFEGQQSIEADDGREIQRLENEYLAVSIFSDASASIVDRKNQERWRMGAVALQEESSIDVGHVWVRSERSICEQYPGRFAGKREGGRIRFTLLDRLRNAKGSFMVQASLDGPWFEYRLLEVDRTLPSLTFPPPIESESLILPMGIGRWVRRPFRTRYFYTFFSHLNMRWFGGARGDKCWMAVFPEKNFVDSGLMVAEMAASPTWLTTLGEWQTARVVRYRFLAGNYVQVAKLYRQWAIEQGLHRTLEEKLKQTPSAVNLARGRMLSLMVADARHQASYKEDLLQSTSDDALQGTGVKVNFTHADTQRIVDELPATGLTHAVVAVRGWINGGYDYSHPDPWPPEPALGSVEQLQRVCRAPDPVTVALHDNYQDMYRHVPSWPKGVNRTQPGKPMPGGYWGGGQAYIINARDGLKYARRNWKSIGQLGARAMFIDTTGAVQMYQSFETGNLLTRLQDMTCKQELLRFFKSQGVALGSEEGADFAVPYVDWFENRHSRQPGETVPLWPLVFHDAVMCGRYVAAEEGPTDWLGGPQADTRYPQWLLDMLWGYFLITRVPDASHWPQFKERVRNTLHVDEWYRRISTAAMVDHRFVTHDEELEMTTFSTGDAIIVNFSPEERNADGQRIPGHGYKLVKASSK